LSGTYVCKLSNSRESLKDKVILFLKSYWNLILATRKVVISEIRLFNSSE